MYSTVFSINFAQCVVYTLPHELKISNIAMFKSMFHVPHTWNSAHDQWGDSNIN